ncbi:hypothetical protein BpHYR1_019954 [Brachionus plicatilis]|uniref:Uncharacterized protein n=1 Tax=Brachionus plicatilis TaxID=10195 RepID=A0A3M7S5L3_BRAPC|nr:hypothetical protein BpHYR1_019954 [Brachionus plicatilis]
MEKFIYFSEKRLSGFPISSSVVFLAVITRLARFFLFFQILFNFFKTRFIKLSIELQRSVNSSNIGLNVSFDLMLLEVAIY